MSLLEDITSRDPHRIWTSSCAIRRLRDEQQLSLLIDHIEEIKVSVAGVSLGGAMRSNSTHVEFAIRKLEYLRLSTECPCCLYLMDDLYNPIKEEEAGNVQVLSAVRPNGTWIDYYVCECSLCGQRYKVEEREYHYTWWGWKLVNGI